MKYAIVAGGSSGIGLAIAHALAYRNYNLILIARHNDKLVLAQALLKLKYGVEVFVIKQDLSLPEAAGSIAEWCLQNKIKLNMLCNVAGHGGKNDFLSLPLDKLRYMVSLNVSSQMALSMSLLPFFETENKSYILNVSSMAGLAPIPAKNLYSATKSANTFFSYSLRFQLKKTNISVSCLCPGPVFTKPEIERDTIAKLGWFGKLLSVKPLKVGEVAIRGTLNGRMLIIPGFLPKIISILLRILPRHFLTYIYYKLG